MERQYTYDAFISYRHTELDKYVAELLHKKLETFKTPKSIIKKNPACKKRIERVFRDKEELPLTNNLEDPIINAIKESEYLIVICSPRLKESLWCKREIETFIQCHGQQKVLAVLIEGEPHESFPDEILYVDEVVQYSDGTMGAIKKPVEPLAADLRGSSKKEIKKALDSEVLRLLAPMLGVTYDDLRQRHRERKLKKIIAASVATASVCLAIGVASTLAALHINRQKNKIETQSIEIQTQAEEIQAQADEIQAQAEEIMLQNEKMAKEQAINLAEEALDKLDDGDRVGAILTAKMALTEYEGITMPYTAEAKYALTESLHVYDAGEKIKAQYQISSIGVIEDFVVSPDDVTVVSYDRTGSLIIWDSVNNQVMGCLTNANSIYANCVSFIDNNKFAYITDEDAIAVHHVGSGSTEDAIVTDDSVYSVMADGSGNYIAITTRDTVRVYDATDYSLVCEHTVPEEYDLDNSLYFADGDTLLFYQYTPFLSEEENKHAIVNFLDIKSGTIYASLTLDYEGVSVMEFKDGYAYIGANDYSDIFNTNGALMKVNLEDGTVVWSTEVGNLFGSYIRFPAVEEGKELMYVSSMDALLVDMETGAVTGTFASNNGIVGAEVYANADQYVIFTSEGEFANINVEYKQMIIIEDFFICNFDSVVKMERVEGGFVVLPNNDNRLTVYQTSVNPDITEYTGTYVAPYMAEYGDYVEQAEELGIEKANMVVCIIEIPDENVIVVSYDDKTTDIFDKTSMEVVETIESSYTIDTYVGKDSEGNIYMSDGINGFAFDTEYQLIAEIEGLIMVDAAANCVVVGDPEEMYQIPIYSTEDLIKLVEEFQ